MNTLPTLSTPTYSLKIPSTGENIEYRPYLVKEEKLLLLAAESNDEKTMLREILRIVETCTFQKVSINSLTMYDLEYIFLQLRIKSVGESSVIKLKCEKDEVGHEADIPLEKVGLVWPKENTEQATSKKIMLSDDIGIRVSHIPAISLTSLSDIKSDANKIIRLIAECVIEVFSKDNVWRRQDVTIEEIQTFIEQCTNPQLQEIQSFISTSPELLYNVKWKCSKCGHQNSVDLKGLADFF